MWSEEPTFSWNSEFQYYLAQEDSFEKFTKISQLACDFSMYTNKERIIKTELI